MDNVQSLQGRDSADSDILLAVDGENSLNYQTADEDGSRYFSVVEGESTLEEQSLDDSSLLASDVAVDKFNVHEKIEETTSSNAVDPFDDNESSVDGHELVIDDDPHQSEKSDEAYRLDDASVDFPDLKEKMFEPAELPPTISIREDTNSQVLSDCKVNLKDLIGDTSEENCIKSENYNFPEGSHRTFIQIDGNNVEAINIGQDIYIYTDVNGVLTSFQLLKDDDGNIAVKYLHVGKNEDGNIEVYEEQVNQIPITSEEAEAAKEKEKGTIIEKCVKKTSKIPRKERKEGKVQEDIVISDSLKESSKTNISSDLNRKSENIVVNCDTVRKTSQKMDEVDLSLNKANLVGNESITTVETNISHGQILNKSPVYEEKVEMESVIINESVENGPENGIAEDDVEEKLLVIDESTSTTLTETTENPIVDKAAPIDEVPVEETKDNTDATQDTLKNSTTEPNLTSNNDELCVSDINKTLDTLEVSDNTKSDSKTDTRSSIDSDDEFCDVVDGAPVTGDCEISWMAQDESKRDEIKTGNEVDQDNPKTVENIIEGVENNDSLTFEFPIPQENDKTPTKPIGLSTTIAVDKTPIINSNNMKVYSPKKPKTSLLKTYDNRDKYELITSNDLISNAIDDLYKDVPDKIDPKTYAAKTYSKHSTPNLSTTPNKIGVLNSPSGAIILVAENDEFADGPEGKHSSPKNKVRQPRKQILTPVDTSSIEIIFPTVNSNNNLTSKYNISKPKSHSSPSTEEVNKALTSKKITNESSLLSHDINVKPESILVNNQQHLHQNGVELDSPPKHNQIVSPKTDVVSNSAKRKRGRPKKILSSDSNTYESVILDLDGSPRKLSPNIRKILNKPDVSMSLPDKTEKVPVVTPPVEEKLLNVNEITKDILKNDSITIDVIKKKKGRPRKILSTSLNVETEKTKDSTRLSLPFNLNKIAEHPDSSNHSTDVDEHICPICNKNFRSSNVLLKHAKHCNGILEFIKLSKQKKSTKTEDDETPSKNSNDLIKLNANKNIEKAGTVNGPNDTKVQEEERNKLGSNLEYKKSSVVSMDVLNISDTKTVDCRVDKVIVDHIPVKPVEKRPEIKKDTVNVIKKEDKKVMRKSLPVKSTRERILKKSMASPMSRLSKILKTKPPTDVAINKCEICNKAFRQLAHLVCHRRKHKLANPPPPKPVLQKIELPVAPLPPIPENSIEDHSTDCNNAILKCEVCKKGFRKLHHLVEHRETHISTETKVPRRLSVVSVKSEPEAGFRCEACDKSFRKLHHLVQHREMHSPENMEPKSPPEVKEIPAVAEEERTCTCGRTFRKRHHMVEHRDIHCSPSKMRKDDTSRDHSVRLSINSSTSEDSNNCGICGKSYRKLHHMVEHRESHGEAALKTVVDESRFVPDRLVAKDIIHECPRCYMVFPNMNALNKHISNCLKRKTLKKSMVSSSENVENKPAFMISKRKSSDSSSSNRPLIVKTSNVENNADKRSFVSKLPRKSVTLSAPINANKMKKAKPTSHDNIVDDEDDDSSVKYRLSSDLSIKYKQSSSLKKSLSNIKSPKPRKSKSIADKVLSPKDLKALIEETTIKYSFPKTPKGKEKSEVIDLVTPIGDRVKTKVPKKQQHPLNAPSRKSALPTTGGKFKMPLKKTSTVIAKRRSLGAKKSLDGKILPGMKKMQMSSSTSNGQHKCDCGKRFENEILLRRHMDAEHTPPKSFKCQTCGVLLRTAAQYAKHRVAHEASSSGSSTSSARVKKTLNMDGGGGKRKSSSSTTTAPTPSTERKKPRAAHGGVPLSDKMKRALANAKF